MANKKKSKTIMEVKMDVVEMAEEVEDVESTPTASTTTTIADVVRSHLDARQRECGGNSTSPSPAYAAACALRRDVFAFYSERRDMTAGSARGNVELEEEEGEVADAIVSCLDSAMSTILRGNSNSSSSTNNKKTRQNGGAAGGCYDESITSIWEMVTSFACLSRGGGNDDRGVDGGGIGGIVPLAMVQRVAGYASLSEYDVGRVEACRLLGMMMRGILSSKSMSENHKSSSILKNRGGGAKKKGKGKIGGDEGDGAVDATAATASSAASPWEVECLLLATKALAHRVTDKIARVRNAAIVAFAPLLALLASSTSPSSSCRVNHVNDAVRKKFLGSSSPLSSDLVSSIDSLLSTLLWLTRNDPSASNRAAVIGILPPLARASVAVVGDGEEEDAMVIHVVIERIGDVDVKVREAALDSLRTNVNDYTMDLSGDMRVDILRTGLTKR